MEGGRRLERASGISRGRSRADRKVCRKRRSTRAGLPTPGVFANRPSRPTRSVARVVRDAEGVASAACHGGASVAVFHRLPFASTPADGGPRPRHIAGPGRCGEYSDRTDGLRRARGGGLPSPQCVDTLFRRPVVFAVSPRIRPEVEPFVRGLEPCGNVHPTCRSDGALRSSPRGRNPKSSAPAPRMVRGRTDDGTLAGLRNASGTTLRTQM